MQQPRKSSTFMPAHTKHWAALHDSKQQISHELKMAAIQVTHGACKKCPNCATVNLWSPWRWSAKTRQWWVAKLTMVECRRLLLVTSSSINLDCISLWGFKVSLECFFFIFSNNKRSYVGSMSSPPFNHLIYCPMFLNDECCINHLDLTSHVCWMMYTIDETKPDKTPANDAPK